MKIIDDIRAIKFEWGKKSSDWVYDLIDFIYWIKIKEKECINDGCGFLKKYPSIHDALNQWEVERLGDC